MKRIYFFTIAALIAANVIGQVPNSFKYQAVLRDASGDIKATQNVAIDVSILQGSTTGTSIYSETHNTSTNAFGLVNLEIGSKNPTGFAAIDWSTGPYFIKITVDGTEMGASQLLSVPYALYAHSVDSVKWSKVQDKPLIPGKTSELTNDAGFITGFTETEPSFNSSIAKNITSTDTIKWNAKSEFSGSYNDLTNTPNLWDSTWITIKGRPDFATVAISGNYNDLSNAPELFDSSWASIKGKPDFSKWDKDSTNDVTLTSDQTIAGNKAFNATIIANNGLNANNKNITNVAKPINNNDASNKAYVDALESRIEVMNNIMVDAGYNGTIMDIDGNVYKTKKIGTQVWMTENLKETHYGNGSLIPNVTINATWTGLFNNGARCYYNNDSATYAAIYGTLYNWYSVIDSRNICPTGWHVPSDAEWTTIETYLGSTPGNKLREAGTSHWTSPNSGADNSSGFTALPGGSRLVPGTFNDIGNIGRWWSSTEIDLLNAHSRRLDYNQTGVLLGSMDKRFGFSIRCIKD